MPDEGKIMADTQKLADARLYPGKQQGRNRVVAEGMPQE
jgi:PleD family two-component response regulator